MGQIDRKSETCYQPVPTTNNNINNFKETLATAKNINFVADCADKDADKDESMTLQSSYGLDDFT